MVKVPVPRHLTGQTPTRLAPSLAWGTVTGATDYLVYRDGVEVADTPTPGYTDTTVTATGGYGYQVQAENGSGVLSSLSIMHTIIYDTTPPPTVAAPTGQSPAMQPSIAWQTVTDIGSGVKSYRVYRDGRALASVSSATTTYTDTTDPPDGVHRYRVRAIDAAGNLGAESPTVAITVDTTAPPPPQGLSAVSPTSAAPALSWKASSDRSGIAGYRVFRDGTLLEQVQGTQYTEPSVLPDSSYSYTVEAVDGAGNVSSPAGPVDVLEDTTAPTVPGGLTAGASPTNQAPALSWQPSSDTGSGVADYVVLRDGSVIGQTTSTGYTDTDALVDGSYAYSVEAVDAAGNTSAVSDPVTVTLDTTPPAAPTGLAAASPTSSAPSLAWSGPADAASYVVYRNGTPLDTTTSPAYVDQSATGPNIYTYTVAAVDSAGNTSAQSSSAMVAMTPITNIVVIEMENHSFDNEFGVMCVQDSRCDGATTGKLASGATIPLTQTPDMTTDQAHTVAAQIKAIDGGKMDGFSTISGCTASTGYACYSQFSPSQIPNVTAMARRFAISDRTFTPHSAATWGTHLDLVAGTMDGFTGDDPTDPNQNGRGCDSGGTTLWQSTPSSPLITVPSCVPAPDGSGPFQPSPVQWVPTIMDRMDAAGVSWKIYAPTTDADGYGRAICPSFADCLDTSQHADQVDVSQVQADATAGVLPDVSFVMPIRSNSQHPAESSMAAGDNWLGSVVSAIENGPQWAHTAVFITDDECGGYYDHVPPPNGLGVRIPMVIVSPYARSGYTDHTVASASASVLAYIEHMFGLAPLQTSDANAYDYGDSFDYTQQPLAPVKTTHTAVPAWEKARVATHPDQSDPT